MIEVDPRVLKQASQARLDHLSKQVEEEKQNLEEEAQATKSMNWLWRLCRFMPKPFPDFKYLGYSIALDKAIKAARQQSEIFYICDIAIATGQSVWLQAEWNNLLPYINRIINPEKQDEGN